MNWTEAKREIQKMDKAELALLLKRLFQLNPENKSFFEASLAGPDRVSLDYYKREISESVHPKLTSPIDLKRARRAIASFKKAAPDDLWGRTDLMIHFVEQGAEFTLEYGTMDGRFYDSMNRMIDSIVQMTDQLSAVETAHFVKRFEELNEKTYDQLGYGFSDHITDVTFLLEDRDNF